MKRPLLALKKSLEAYIQKISCLRLRNSRWVKINSRSLILGNGNINIANIDNAVRGFYVNNEHGLVAICSLQISKRLYVNRQAFVYARRSSRQCDPDPNLSRGNQFRDGVILVCPFQMDIYTNKVNRYMHSKHFPQENPVRILRLTC